MFQINIFRNFREDKRRSMDNYAIQLQKILNLNFQYKQRIIIPKIGFLKNLRLSRYLTYPSLVKKLRNKFLFKNIIQFNHIVEDGYAHLIKNLDNSKTVVTVHDLIPLVFWKKNILKKKPPILYMYSLSFLKKAKYIFADSLNTKKDLVKYCDCDSKKIFVVYLGYNHNFFKFNKKKKFFYRKKIFKDCYDDHLILITGQEFYKNHDRAIQSIINSKEKFKKNITIIHIGAKEPSIIKTNLFKKSFIKYKRFSNLKLKELVNIYNSCDCLLFPSLYEGFGLPVIEAMACGLPVVTSREGSLREISSSALHCDAYSVKNISKQLELILTNSVVRKKLIKNGIKNAYKFSEDKFKDKIIYYYKIFLKEYEK